MAVAAPETTSFWGVEGGKSVVLVVAAPSGEAPSAESSKEKPSFPGAAASEKTPIGEVAAPEETSTEPSSEEKASFRAPRRRRPFGGSAADGAKGEKTPVLTVAASGATSFGGAASNETAVAASEACCFGGAETSEATPNEASSEEKPPLSVAAPSPTLWAEARQTASKTKSAGFDRRVVG